eukprot:TRINITY_DN29742_c0_g1_i2.p1 TRINITY_DN29742_c0_g1~~TRINITY_DN29742_c0_g1_i2.p1  ORF type:complete len:246 (+),score=27.26 TRINITY_DN29742_c0_g1_i2:75-740(+)
MATWVADHGFPELVDEIDEFPQAGKEAARGPPPTCEYTPPPCQHNNWDNVRMKDFISSLRCRDCQQTWKVHCAYRDRCADFDAGRCDRGRQCSHTHIHRRKQTLHERIARFGQVVQRQRGGADAGKPQGKGARRHEHNTGVTVRTANVETLSTMHSFGAPGPAPSVGATPEAVQMLPYTGMVPQGGLVYHVPVVAMMPQQAVVLVGYPSAGTQVQQDTTTC